MRHFNNILYVGHGTTDETEGLKQALSLARNNKAALKVLVVCPVFPADKPDFKKKYEEALLEQAKASCLAIQKALEIASGDVEVSLELASDDKPAVRIIQHVLRNGHDLLVKEPEPHDRGAGFKAVDMALLRKCPCPVWLCRPIEHSRQKIRVGVAIDPESAEDAARVLSGRMLQISRTLADSCSGKLHIVSCWDYEYEDFVRHSPWAKKDEQAINEIVSDTQTRHRSLLDELIGEAKLTGENAIFHLRGKPAEVIPAFVRDEKIDILFMGTVARTGIPGFMIGNTAENIVQELTCSLIALKPQGFVSPVKPFA